MLPRAAAGSRDPPLAELTGAHYHLVLSLAGAGWLAAFALFVVVYGPMLLTRRK